MFPKILHQTWKTKDLSSIPEFEACSRSWRRHHPDYRYVLWDDRENADFVRTQFGWYYDTWASFDKNIKRWDSIRYMWMYAFGGIYADLDMECLNPLDDLLTTRQESDTVLFCDLDNSGECVSANPALIVSKPGCGLWLGILDYAKEHRERYVTECTGPTALGNVLRARRSNFRASLLDQNRLFIRKYSGEFYSSIPGNEDDAKIYQGVFCTTPKPAKYYEDRKHKYVADWHGTPAEFRWHREYLRDSRNPRWRKSLLERIRGRVRSIVTLARSGRSARPAAPAN